MTGYQTIFLMPGIFFRISVISHENMITSGMTTGNTHPC